MFGGLLLQRRAKVHEFERRQKKEDKRVKKVREEARARRHDASAKGDNRH